MFNFKFDFYKYSITENINSIMHFGNYIIQVDFNVELIKYLLFCIALIVCIGKMIIIIKKKNQFVQEKQLRKRRYTLDLVKDEPVRKRRSIIVCTR